MKLKAISTYQSVKFQSNMHTFFTQRPGMEDLSIELLPNGIVHLKTSKDEIVVWPTNICYGVPANKETSKMDHTLEPRFADKKSKGL